MPRLLRPAAQGVVAELPIFAASSLNDANGMQAAEIFVGTIVVEVEV